MVRATGALTLLLRSAALVAVCGGVAFAQLSDLTQPGDSIVPTSNNSPGSEGAANAIDNQPTKYLNFDKLNTGFTVTPSAGLSVVQCLTLTSANDAPERDPASYSLAGSYDGTTFTTIASGAVAPFTMRLEKQVIPVDNDTPYLVYRLIFPTVANAGTANSMQIAEVELLGFVAPGDVTVPGDPVVPTSNNSPGSEGAANAIDNQPTKYLNFDELNTGFSVTPSIGPTLVTGLTLRSANDAPERDPASYILSGSLDGTNFFEIASGSVPAFPSRFFKNYIFFDNSRAYMAYRVVFPTVANSAAANSMQIAEVEFLGVPSVPPQDVTQPGDPIVATSNNSPGSEGVANAIDNQPTKYLNFDELNTGFTVSPSVGLTTVSGLTLTSANDAPERDPASYELSGSYDGTNFTVIASDSVPAFPSRFFKRTILFDNQIPYLRYRLIFPTVANAATANSMQISEVELLGVLAPTDVTMPGDPIVPTSTNSPGSEGAANAIDNQPTKYLNFDELNTGFTVTPGVGSTIVTGLTITSANDAPERDPASYTIGGSNDAVNFVEISSGSVPAFPSRFLKNFIFFPDNTKSFTAYKLIFPTVANSATANSMQLSEVELLGIVQTPTPTASPTTTSSPTATATPTSTPTGTATATPTPTDTPQDLDDDGIGNGTENGAPNGGDGNGDGVPDSMQPNVASLPSATGCGYLTLIVSAGVGGCHELQDVHTTTEEALGTDFLFDYPCGLIGFALDCAASADLTLIFHGSTGGAMTYRKFGPTPPQFDDPQFYTLPNVTFGTAQIPLGTGPVLTTAMFTLANGQLGDGTAAADDRIVDPGGPAVASSATPAPATSTAGLVIGVGLLLLLGVLAMRRAPSR